MSGTLSINERMKLERQLDVAEKNREPYVQIETAHLRALLDALEIATRQLEIQNAARQ